MRLVFFGADGFLSVHALHALGARHEIVGVVRAVRGPSPVPSRPAAVRGLAIRMALAMGWRGNQTLTGLARAFRAPLWDTRSGKDPEITARVARVKPDLICITGFPWLVGADLLALPAAGALNAHAALLPRHRGPLPLFWIYYHDDRDTGVTVHRVTERADAGEILAQARYALPRGLPVETLNRLNADRGAVLLVDAVEALATGRATGTAQDETRATEAPMVRAGTRMIDFDHWDVERVWHFTAGLFPRFQEPLLRADGTPVRYSGVLGYETREERGVPGSVTPAPHGFDLHCRGGVVRLRA